MGRDRYGKLRLCIVDMNNGHVNQAMRCLRGIAGTFFEGVHAANPGLTCELVDLRNSGDTPKGRRSEVVGYGAFALS